MPRPAAACVWSAVALLAMLAGCGGGGGAPGGAPDGPPPVTPTAYLQFFHPVSGRALASGARFELPYSLRPGSTMQPFILPTAESKPDTVPITPVPITYVLERQPWPRGLVFDAATRTLRGTLDPTVEHPPSYRLDYRASAPGHLDVHLSIVLYLPPTLRPGGFTTLSFPVGRSTVTVLPAARGGRPPYAYELTGCVVPAWLRREGRSLHGSPTAANQHEPARLCRWRVTDSAGGVAEFETEISVGAGPRPRLFFPAADGTPLEDDAPLPPLGTLVQGEPLPALHGFFPAAQGARPGTRITYGLQGASGPPGVRGLPNGLGFDPAQQILTGMIDDPQWPAGTYLLYYVASAPGHVDARRTVSFDLEDPLRLDASSAGPFSFQVGAFTRRTLPRAKGGTRPHRYTLEQCPLAWLELVGTELVANPRPGHAGEKRLCRYRVTDAVGASDELVLQVSAGTATVLGFDTAADDFPEDGDELPFQVGRFARRSLAEAAGGVPPYRYSLEQCPLAWLELVGTELAANPQAEHSGARRLCRYQVTDAEGGVAYQVLDVSATPVPINVFQFENRHIVDRDLPVGSEIDPIVLPNTVNEMGRVRYELSPVLPTGLRFHQPAVPSGRPEIRGTPTAISLLTRYCVHATDASDASATPRCFHLRTVGHEVPRFTVNLQSGREVLLYTTLISSTEREPPQTIGVPIPLVNRSIQLPVAFLPPSWDGEATYTIVPDLDPFRFVSDTRRLTSPVVNEDHPLPTPVVYTYGVRRETGDTLFAAAICFELGRRIDTRTVPITASTERVYRDTWFTLTFRDEAVRTSTGEYLCHPNPRGDDEPAGTTAQSNPVHDALGMVHARRAVRLAHGLIGERVRDPSPPGGESVAFHSDVDLARVWGRSGGFSWSGTGESLLAGADVVQPGGALQLGLVAGFHRTALDYRAEARRLEGRYSAGEHFTEILSMHPFAAWRFTTDSVVWGSAGAGAGSLWFEDDAPPFDERRRSGLDLRSAALGFRHPLPWSALGRFSFSGLAEHIALRIEGDEAEHGIRPRSLRGSDLALGLDWRRRPADAEPSLVPSLSLGVRHQSGDGAAGSLIDVGGSIAYRPRAQPLSFDVAASTLLGVAGNDSGSWDVRASARYDPDPGARGLELSLRSVLGAAADDAGAAYGVDGELAYGVFGGAFGSTVRPYVSMSRFAGASGARRAAGLRLRDEPGYRLSLETYEHTGTDSAGLNVRLHRRWP